MTKIVFALPGNESLADSLASGLSVPRGELVTKRFPDGESYLRVESDVNGKEVILVCTLHEPDDKLLPLYFLSRLLNELGAIKITLVAPYLAYMRQDKVFIHGEAITSAYFAKLISTFIDELITVDPHLHRTHSMSEIYNVPCKVLHASKAISQYISSHIKTPLLIGPDSESGQWVSEVAKNANAPYIILKKIRLGDSEVKISSPDLIKYPSHTPVLVDDIISTAQTMIETVTLLKNAGMAAPVCIGVHAVFAGMAYQELKNAGPSGIITCNTISHESNKIDIVPLLLKALK